MSGLVVNPIRNGMDLNVHAAEQKVKEAQEAYQTQLKEVHQTFENIGDSELMPNMLNDDVWKAPKSVDFKKKYLEHKMPAVRKLAELHAAETSLRKDLEALELQLLHIELDEKTSKMSDGDRVIKHSIEELCFQLNGIVKGISLRHSVMTGPAFNSTIEIGKKTSILFVARDDTGKPVLDLTEDAFQVLVDGLRDDGVVEIPVKIGRGKTLNIFTFTFTLPQAGRFRIAIWLGKLPLEGSPYTVCAGPDPMQGLVLQKLSVLESDMLMLRNGCYNMCTSRKWTDDHGYDYSLNGHLALEDAVVVSKNNNPNYTRNKNPFVKPS